MAKKKKKQSQNTQASGPIPRPPVIAVMGHIDHGKSTLLDYIRHANVTGGEAGGITQHISAYEFEHSTKDGKTQRITFLDTPGHEAFSAMRSRGAGVADIAVIVVSAEDGVKPQTTEAFSAAQEADIPYIVAINKIDRPQANVEWTKQNLAEHGIYLESYGGNVPSAEISAKTGTGVDDLLDLMLLQAELEELTGDPSKPAEGIIIESNVDPQKGAAASLIIKDGTLRQGMALATPGAFAPVRIMEDFLGQQIREATFSSPVRIYGWNGLPAVGEQVVSFEKKKDAEHYAAEHEIPSADTEPSSRPALEEHEKALIPVIIVGDTSGSVEAVVSEIAKFPTDRVDIQIVHKNIGAISENDIKLASTHENSLVVGFNTTIDGPAARMAERLDVETKTFSIIYELLEWLEEAIAARTPTVYGEETLGKIKILKTFSKSKNKQIIGGKVVEGVVHRGDQVKIMRRDEEIGRGELKDLQQQHIKTDSIEEGNECGLMVEARKEIASGDVIEAFHIVEK